MGDGMPSRLPLDDNRTSPEDPTLRSLIGGGVQRSQSDMASDPYNQSQYAAGATGMPSLDMRSLSGALPNLSQPRHNYPTQSFQQFPGTSQGQMYQYSQGGQFAGQAGANFNPNSPQILHNQYPQIRHNYGLGFPISNQSFQSTGHQMPQGMVQNVQQPYAQQHLHPSSQYSQFSIRGGEGATRGGYVGSTGFYQNSTPQMTRTSSNSSRQQSPSASVLRGPPRKPKQSGHALWVGNLPPGTNIVDLKDYFSKDATDEIESVFLISKSNCAFVNYKSEESCQAAMNRFHETRFQGVRLVCRLRRGSSTSPAQQGAEGQVQSPGLESSSAPTQPQERMKEKFFVVKSLTLEDLERSVHSGVWATQAHNEAALSKAYESADDVYLIFSANKSGEYFGYARMDSAIGDEEAAAKTEILPQPTTDTTAPSPNLADLPMAIITPATASAPKGRIIDDSSRGTIFWEALTASGTTSTEDVASSNPTTTQQSSEKPTPSGSGNVSSGEAGYESAVSATGSPTPQSFGKPFKITWLSNDRLPFFRTRGLRNPWNANREVKIARDGTEIEPNVGKRLIQMFHIKFPDPAPPHPHQQYPGQQYQSQQQMGGRGMMPPIHPSQMMQGYGMPLQGGGGGGRGGGMMQGQFGGSNY